MSIAENVKTESEVSVASVEWKPREDRSLTTFWKLTHLPISQVARALKKTELELVNRACIIKLDLRIRWNEIVEINPEYPACLNAEPIVEPPSKAVFRTPIKRTQIVRPKRTLKTKKVRLKKENGVPSTLSDKKTEPTFKKAAKQKMQRRVSDDNSSPVAAGFNSTGAVMTKIRKNFEGEFILGDTNFSVKNLGPLIEAYNRQNIFTETHLREKLKEMKCEQKFIDLIKSFFNNEISIVIGPMNNNPAFSRMAQIMAEAGGISPKTAYSLYIRNQRRTVMPGPLVTVLR